MAARKPVQDADLTALATLVGAEGMMDVQIFRDVTDGNNPVADWELLDTWPVALDDFKSGAFAMSVGATTGGGLYRFVATKPGSQAKPVEWGIRLSGDPKPPPRVRAERAARQPQAAAYQQPGFAQPGFAGAPVSPLPIGGGVPLYGMGAPYGVPYGHGPYGHGSYGAGMPPWAQPWSQPWAQPWSQPPLVQPQAPAAQPAVSDALTKAVEGMTSVFTQVIAARHEEATVPTEVRAELDRMRIALDEQKRTAAESLARHERELAEARADAQRARDLAVQQERDAKHDREVAQMRADSDKRFEAIQREVKDSREAAERAAREAADKAKSAGPDPTVTAMTESLRLIAKQAEEAGKDARVAMTEAFKAAAARQEHPDWLVQMALQSNAPQAMQQMAAAYGQLFQSTAAMTQAQLAALADQLGEGKEGVVDALREAFGGLVAIGKKIVDRAAEQPTQPLVPASAQQRMRLAGAQQPRALPHGQAQPGAQPGAQQGAQPQAGANGTAARTGAPAPVVQLHQRRGLNWGSLSEPHGQLTKAVAEYNLAPEVAAEKIVALVEFSEAFGLAVAPTLIRLAQSNLAELVEVVLPGAPEEYRAKVAAAILAATRDEDEDAPAAGAGAGDAGGAGAAEDAPEDVPEDVPDGNAAGGGDDGDTDGGAPDAPSPA